MIQVDTVDVVQGTHVMMRLEDVQKSSQSTIIYRLQVLVPVVNSVFLIVLAFEFFDKSKINANLLSLIKRG